MSGNVRSISTDFAICRTWISFLTSQSMNSNRHAVCGLLLMVNTCICTYNLHTDTNDHEYVFHASLLVLMNDYDSIHHMLLN